MSGLISIIVPVYNLEKYIKHTLDSIFAQTYKEIEVIAVDDGSTDNSQDILDEYAKNESRLRVIHQVNGGVSAARNTGIAAATGDYIGFCDGDDEIEPVMYEHLLSNLLKYKADISHCGMMIKGLDGKVRYFHNTGALEVHSHDEGLIEILKGVKIEPSLCLKLFRKELFKHLIFDNAIQINEDLLANVSLFRKAKKTVYEDKCYYHYIRRENSASKCSISEKHIIHPIKVRENILDLCKNETDIIKQQAKVCYLATNISIISRLQNEDGLLYHNFISIFRNNLKVMKNDFKLLSFTTRTKAYLILYFPILSHFLFSIYYSIKGKKYG